MSKQVLKENLIDALKSINVSEVTDMAEDDETVEAMVDKLINEPTVHLTSFADYLQNGCAFLPIHILSIIQALISKPEVLKDFGKKISSLWLLFKLYKQLDIHVNKPPIKKQKRKSLRNAFVAYNFLGSNLANLLMACIPAIGDEVDEQSIQDYIGMIGTRPGVNLPALFLNEPEPELQEKIQPQHQVEEVYNADKSVEEQLEDLIKDYKIFPEGSLEKELQRQLVLAHIQKNKTGVHHIGQLPQSKRVSDIDALRNKFVQQFFSVPAEIQQLFNKAKTDEVYESLCALKSKIFGINVLQLSRLIDKTNDARKLIENKDVIFMIGNTGSGKSTNILRFLGYDLKFGKVGKLTTLVPTKELHKDHKTFYTSPQAKSCTRYINAVAIPVQMYKKNTPERKMNLVICDSPGFGDSAGVQVDIANGVGMINALHGARSVRVVVILPYDSLTGDRMAGAIKMGQIISNLFFELTVLESIVIYFNKVPENKISEVPNLIQSKIKNLNETEKTNKKLKTFLTEMHQRSKDEENFIEPIKGDYKKLFNTISNIPPITDARQSFQYEFTSLTKRQIDRYVQGERAKVRELFLSRKYHMSQFHFKMIETMKHTLHNDDKIKVYYDELSKFIQAESEKQLNYFEEIINEIMSARGSINIKVKLDDSRNKIIEIQRLFKEFEGVHVVQASKIEEIIKGRKDRLLDSFNNLDEVTSQTIIAAKSFSTIVDKTLEEKVIAIIEKRFNEIYLDTDRQAKSKCFSEIGNNLKYLSSLASYISQLIQESAINNLANRLRDLKNRIGNEAELARTWIAQNINKAQARINDNTIRQANQNIELVKEIVALKILDNNNQINTQLTNELKKVEGKCRNTIRDIENLRLTLNDNVGNNSIDKEELKNKKRQIEMLIKIENLEQNLAEDYKYAKESINRRLKQNVEILKNCILALKSDKSDEINKNLDNIKKATNMVLQCSQIVDQGDGQEIAASIGEQFINYLNGVKHGLHTIEFKLSQINEDTLKKIRQQHNKIESYAKMGSIGGKVQQALNNLNDQFMKKLRAPFNEYKTREIPFLKEKGHYKFITYSIEKLEKFSIHALGVNDIVSADQYAIISDCETEIIEGLRPFYEHMEKDIENFIKLQFAHSVMPPELKDIVKTLLTINLKNKACEYLTHKLNFQVGEKLNNIQNKLQDIKDKIENAYQESQTNAVELQLLLADCKQFSDVEDIYKSKGEPQNKFGFRELQRRCNDELMKSLKSDEQRCKVIIEGKKPTNILFSQLQTYYEKFVNLKTAEGVRKRRLIVDELKKVEQKTLTDLNQFRKTIGNLSFNNLSGQIEDFLETLNQAVALERNLKQLYSLKEDKELIGIKKSDVHSVGIKIISVFESEYEILTELLNNLNLIGINEKLKTFGQLQNMIYDVFSLDDGGLEINEEQKIEKVKKSYSEVEQMGQMGQESISPSKQKSMYETPGKNASGEERLAAFIKDKVALLRGKIQSHPFTNQGKISARNAIRLKILLEILKRGVEMEIKAKYESDGPTFNIDENFQSFYSNSTQQKRKALQSYVENYLSEQYSEYKENYNCEKDAADKIRTNIEQRIRLLPTELRINHNKTFNQIKKTLIKENDDVINNASKNIIQKPQNIANFFSLADRARKNAQTDLHKKFVKRFVDVYSEIQTKELTLELKIAFVEKSFINVHSKQKEYLEADTLVFEQLKKKYLFWINNISKVGKSEIEQILEIVSVTGGNDQKKKKNHKLIVSNIFTVYYFVLRLRDDGIIDHGDFRKKFLEQYQLKLNEVVECYIETLKCRPQQKLNSKEALEKIKKLQEYVEDITFVGVIMEEIKSYLDKNTNMTKSLVGHSFLSSIYTIEPYTSKIDEYETTIAAMQKFINDFEFCSDVKRNFTPKQIEQDLGELDRYFEILKQQQRFFTTYIIKKPQNQYNITIIIKNLGKKFDQYYQESKKQIEETFQNIDGQQANGINLFIRQLKIMRIRDRDLKFIDAEKVKKSADEISKYLNQKFQNQKDTCAKALETAKVKFAEVTREIQLLQAKRRKDVEEQQNKSKAILDAKLTELKKKCDEKVSVESDENKKNDYRKDMANEQNSARNEIQQQRDKKIKVIEDQCAVKVKGLNESLKAPIQAFTAAVTIFQKATQDIFQQTQKHKKNLDTVLENLTKVPPKFIKQIQENLEKNPKDQRSIGAVILSSNKVFAKHAVAKIQKLIQGQDIDYVLTNLQRITLTGRDKLHDYEKTNVYSLYKKFKAKYDEYKDKYTNSPTQTTIKYMITPIKDLGTQIKLEFYQSKNPLKQAQSKVELLAGIFALWAILKSETFEGEVQYTIEPHPTQISTLILLLGICQPDEKQNNRLAQVGTGEGKSIVLAGLSSYLALVGFKVRCACYSAYLSGRDQESFKTLFERLGIENNIKYGTFNQLCEDILNGSGANLKDQVEKMLLQPPQGFFQKAFSAFGFNKVSLNRGPNEITQNPTILVIDEVDVFFEDSYFGNSYCPGISLRSPAVSNFLEAVWREVQTKGKDTEPETLIKSKQFDQLVDRYPSLKDLLKNQVNGMVSGALNYKHDYFIIEKRIAYKDNDTISYKINYGYKTVFAYLHEFQNNRVSKAYLDEALQITLMIAEFSYAALPNYFCNILGVTGTLQVLPYYKKHQLSERYAIKDQYAIPSAFGINKKRIENYYLTPTANYNKKIVEMINQVTDDRPIIIFFKGPRELNEFFSCAEYQPFLKRTYNLTEEHDASVRDSRIFNAVEPKKITLMSSAYGRGTDFVIRNDNIKEKGGLHIIHGFLSLDESEEVQIKGRTARQNAKGSYDCVIDENWLEQLTLTPANFPKDAPSGDIHSVLLRARQDRMEKLSQSTIKMLVEADRKHNNVVQIFSTEKLAQSDLITYVSGLNKYPEIRKVTIKTVLGLDATGSMSGALRKACEVIGTAFERNYAVLKQKDVKATIEVKIMVYRNYNSPVEQIIQGTTFENTPANLKQFLDRVGPKGGWGNEAIQVLFQFMNREQKIDQVILIGDAAPNTTQEVTSKRTGKGEQYWLSNGFPLTNFEKELAMFKNTKKCPVHCFQLGAQHAFQNISNQTGGKCNKFNLHSARAADDLTDFVVMNILELIEKNAGQSGGSLVETYRKMFIK